MDGGAELAGKVRSLETELAEAREAIIYNNSWHCTAKNYYI